jgi:hypothetical protein
MNKPLVSEKEKIFDYNVINIWNIVINNSDYKWRTGIKQIKLLENDNWIEYYSDKEQNFTKFTLVKKDEYTLYSFKMENKRFHGNWSGKFININDKQTKCIFKETIYIRNPIIKILAKIFWNLEKIQEQYFTDLEKKLKE